MLIGLAPQSQRTGPTELTLAMQARVDSKALAAPVRGWPSDNATYQIACLAELADARLPVKLAELLAQFDFVRARQEVFEWAIYANPPSELWTVPRIGQGLVPRG